MYIYILIAFAIAALCTLVLLPWIMHLCYKNGIYDSPNVRKVHQSGIPRLGGVVFVPSAAIALNVSMLLCVDDFSIASTVKLSSILLGMGMLVVYLLGFLDDMFGLGANLKFVIQFAAALTFPIVGLYFNNLYGLFGVGVIDGWVAYSLTVFLVMFVVNAMNTIDGIDGLASGLSIITLLIYCYFFYVIGNYVFCLFSGALIGTLVVFIYFNLFGSPEKGTKTFMGDSGSLMLGFVLSYMGVKLSMENPLCAPPRQGILIPLSVLMLPTFDLVRVAVARMLRGEHPFHPDKTHIHHLLLKNAFSQRQALTVLLIADILFVALNLLLWECSLQITLILLIDVILYAVGVLVLQTCADPELTLKSEFHAERNEQPSDMSGRSVSLGIPHSFNYENIRFSIIVATYNSEKTLADTFDSLLRQTYQNFEVILCDGVSTDNTMRIVESYRTRFGNRLRAVSEPDCGLYDAMNKGIERATGDIVGILNSDDFYTSNDVLERIVKAFVGNPLLEAVYGDVHYVNPDDLSRTVRYYSSRLFKPRYMRMGFMPAHPSFYCLRSLYSTYGKFRIEYKVAADFDQLFRLIFMNRIRTQYIPMDFVTMRTGGVSTSGLRSHVQILKDHVRTLRSQGVEVSYALFAIRYAFKCGELIWGHLTRNNK